VSPFNALLASTEENDGTKRAVNIAFGASRHGERYVATVAFL
jgi:hypothetical protein